MTHRIRARLLLPLVFSQLCLLAWGLPAGAQEKSLAADGPWISNAIWLSDTQVAGTKSQGLLRRPAQVVTASVDNLTELTTVGEAEMSLWTLAVIQNDQLISTDYIGGIHIFGDGEPASISVETNKWIRAMSATPDPDKLLVGDEDGKLIEFSVENRAESRQVDAHQAAIFDIAFNPAGDKLATACGDGSIKLFGWPELNEIAHMSRGPDTVWAVLFTPEGQQLVSGGGTDNRRIQLWDVATASSICTLTRTRDWITDLVSLPGSSLVVASCMDGRLVVADTESRLKVAELEAAESAIWSLDLSPDGRRLVLGTRKHGFVVVDVPDWISDAQAIAQEAAQTRPPEPVTEAN